MFLCQLELPPAMIKHSWWKTECCTDPRFIYKGMYLVTLHLFASKMILLGLKFQDCCLLDLWKCSGCSCSPKLPWKLAAFGLIWRARRKKPSDSWGQKKQACIKSTRNPSMHLKQPIQIHNYTHRFIDRISLREIWSLPEWWMLIDHFMMNPNRMILSLILLFGVQNSACRSYFVLALAWGFGGLGLHVEGFKQKKNKKGEKRKPLLLCNKRIRK